MIDEEIARRTAAIVYASSEAFLAHLAAAPPGYES